MKQFNPADYLKDTYRTFMIRIDRRKNPELISFLEKKENRSEYVRSLIYKDMANHGKEKKRL